MDGKAKRILGALAVPAFLIGTDFTGAMLLVTPIEQEYSVDITTTQWVLNAYALTLSMGLVAGGRLGDMFGHRKYMLWGLGIFFIASLGCIFSPTVSVLVVSRALQGIGSALLWPCVLAMAATHIAEEERGAAFGILLGAVAFGNVISPFVAGVLSALGDWRAFDRHLGLARTLLAETRHVEASIPVLADLAATLAEGAEEDLRANHARQLAAQQRQVVEAQGDLELVGRIARSLEGAAPLAS